MFRRVQETLTRRLRVPPLFRSCIPCWSLIYCCSLPLASSVPIFPLRCFWKPLWAPFRMIRSNSVTDGWKWDHTCAHRVSHLGARGLACSPLCPAHMFLTRMHDDQYNASHLARNPARVVFITTSFAHYPLTPFLPLCRIL